MTIERKIKNKERCGVRGPKLRYSIFRSMMNQQWERVCELRCFYLCKDFNLNIEDFKSLEKRNTWEHTLENLENHGYKFCSKSWRDNQIEYEQISLKENANKCLDYLLADKIPPIIKDYGI